MERIRIPVGPFTFDAVVEGPDDGRLVLLLHGFPESAHEWDAQLAGLAAAGYRAVAPDQRGYSPGARPEGVAAYHITHLVKDVVAIADALGHPTFDIVGHDWGALVAWHVAGRHPARVRTASIVSVPHPQAFAAARALDPEQKKMSEYIAMFRQPPDGPEQIFLGDDASGLRAAFAELTPAAAEHHVRTLSSPGAMTAALNYYRAWDDELDLLGPVSVPTLFVWSTGDVALGRVGAEATKDWVTGPYRFEVLEGCSHWIPEVAPQRLNQLLLDHLASVADGS